jgi:hypothetical protein
MSRFGNELLLAFVFVWSTMVDIRLENVSHAADGVVLLFEANEPYGCMYLAALLMVLLFGGGIPPSQSLV